MSEWPKRDQFGRMKPELFLRCSTSTVRWLLGSDSGHQTVAALLRLTLFATIVATVGKFQRSEQKTSMPHQQVTNLSRNADHATQEAEIAISEKQFGSLVGGGGDPLVGVSKSVSRK